MPLRIPSRSSRAHGCVLPSPAARRATTNRPSGRTGFLGASPESGASGFLCLGGDIWVDSVPSSR